MSSPLVGFSIDIGKGGEVPGGDSGDGGDAEVPRDGEGGGSPTWRRRVGRPENWESSKTQLWNFFEAQDHLSLLKKCIYGLQPTL